MNNVSFYISGFLMAGNVKVTYKICDDLPQGGVKGLIGLCNDVKVIAFTDRTVERRQEWAGIRK